MDFATLDMIRREVLVSASPHEIDEVHAALADAGAIVRGHFALQSGAHADRIFRVRGFARHPERLSRLTELMVASTSLTLDGATLLCPESAGYLVANQIARHSKLPLAIARVDLVRRPTHELVSTGPSSFSDIGPGSDVVIVNDVASTGASIDTLRRLAERRGARVRGALILAATQGSQVRAYLQEHRLLGGFLLEGRWNVHPSESCPQCLARDRNLLPVAEFN